MKQWVYSVVLFMLSLNNQWYECALIRNWVDRIPVVPVFIAEYEAASKHLTQFNSHNTVFPKLSHKREDTTQQSLDKLWYVAGVRA